MPVELVQFPKVSCYASNTKEVGHIYKEIFEDDCYSCMNLGQSPFIVDAGANVGLFTLYMKQKYPASKILAFEPAPETYDVLCRNLQLHNLSDTKPYPFCLSSKEGTQKLTYFPNMPGNSTLNPSEKEEQRKQTIEQFGEEAARYYFGGACEVDVRLQRLSHFLYNEVGITKIDLVKIDVEGAELEVLLGLNDVHWDLIQNIVLEIWEGSSTRLAIEDLLQSKGFSFTCEGLSWAPESFFMIRASRAKEAIVQGE
ncbi:FkbM family methyltransferase [Aspergillus affinis]|uniref:FkbM family methyltransferase n=1 Tax=Aspergillus affinis TaxID=1070780 RepID=UPI0022FDFDD6|nr:uncharacterized protein KD926_004241 [Aspergillus affinis]KAI9035246.1 hypothetical protein KD926_004241 [Aspergillus affinis]